jgi:hypothetical protein
MEIHFVGFLGTVWNMLWQQDMMFSPSVSWGRRLQKQGGCCLDSKGSSYYGFDISAIVDCIDEPTCGIMCRDIMNM